MQEASSSGAGHNCMQLKHVSTSDRYFSLLDTALDLSRPRSLFSNRSRYLGTTLSMNICIKLSRHRRRSLSRKIWWCFTCLCEHAVVYASWIVKGSEGRNDPFTFLTCYLKQAPDIVVYDFACGLMEYCLNRAPDYFKYCRFVVDRFHVDNHVGCSKALGKVHQAHPSVVNNGHDRCYASG
jgi:hypothetical protein